MRRSHLAPSLSISYKEPLHIVRGAGQYLYDDQGREYLDGVNNIQHVGHCHPTVVKAAHEQYEKLNTNTRYLDDTIVQYARELTSHLPKGLDVCYFTNSGSESNDLALRLARHFTKSRETKRASQTRKKKNGIYNNFTSRIYICRKNNIV